jgi:opacity protein-like surface antigen
MKKKSFAAFAVAFVALGANAQVADTPPAIEMDIVAAEADMTVDMDVVVEDISTIEEEILIDADDLDDADMTLEDDFSTDEDFESDAINSESDEG